MKRMEPFHFIAVEKDGTRRAVTFYGQTRAGALRNARAWAERVGCEIHEGEDEGRVA